jgi:hypothetical protein
MKMETPFTGQIASLGKRSASGHFLSLRGVWTLRQGAVVYHRPEGLEGRVGVGTTVIGEIQSLHVWAGRLYCTGLGVAWLSDMLRAGSHALSMEMRDIKTEGTQNLPVIVAGCVQAALLVKGAQYSWTEKGKS